MFNPGQIKLLSFMQQCSAEQSVKIYVVGGVVRDILLNHQPKDRDVDFVVEGNAIEFADYCHSKSGGKLKTFPDFYTAKILEPNGFDDIQEIDLASSREESYDLPGRLPTVRLSDIKNDLKRRDFTINAMAVSVEGLLLWSQNKAKLEDYALDFFGGFNDIGARKVRVLHAASFIDDPTRIFRAFRYLARISGELEKGTEDSLKQAMDADSLSSMSAQRKINEIKKILSEENRVQALNLIHKYGILERFPLYPADMHAQIMEFISQMPELINLSSDEMYQVYLRIFYYFGGMSKVGFDGQKAFAELGLGQNEIKRISQDTRLDHDFTSKQVMQRLTKPGLVFLSLILEGQSLSSLLDYANQTGVVLK